MEWLKDTTVMNSNGIQVHRCEGEIGKPPHRAYQCEAKASVQRDGWWYCKRHDPEAILARELIRHHEEIIQ